MPRNFREGTSANKNVSGSAHFVRSDLHGLELLWHGSEVQRILEVPVQPRFVVATSETSERYLKCAFVVVSRLGT